MVNGPIYNSTIFSRTSHHNSQYLNHNFRSIWSNYGEWSPIIQPYLVEHPTMIPNIPTIILGVYGQIMVNGPIYNSTIYSGISHDDLQYLHLNFRSIWWSLCAIIIYNCHSRMATMYTK